MKNDAPTTQSRRHVLIVEFGPVSLLVAEVLRLFRFEVSYVRSRFMSRPMEARANARGFLPLQVEHAPRSSDSRRLFVEPKERAITLDSRFGGDQLCARLSRLFTRYEQVRKALRVTLTTRRASTIDEVVIIELWRQSLPKKRALIFCPDAWTRLMLKNPRPDYFGRIIAALDAFLWRVRLASAGFRHSARKSRRPLTASDSIPKSNHSRNDYRVLFVPHSGPGYGRLFLWDQFFSSDPSSALWPETMAALTYNNCSLHDLMLTVKFHCGARPIRMLRLFKVLLYGLPGLRSWSDLTSLWVLSREVEASLGLAAWLQKQFPAAKVAIFAYEMLVPIRVSIGLTEAGVRTIATLERPTAVFYPQYPFILDTLLTPSPYFSSAMRTNPSAAIHDCIEVGTWRTDLIWESRSLAAPTIVNQARRKNQKFVVCLPYHAAETQRESVSSIATSWSTAKTFLRDIVKLAEQYTDVMFVIRGKDADWWYLEAFESEVKKIQATGNIWVDQDYSMLNRSYHLIAHAHAVIARHTSLAEETLAMGIPTIFHDYSHNLESIRESQTPYLPASLWAHSFDQLGTLLEFALEDQGHSFQAWWEPIRQEVFGDLDDGQVKRRIHHLVESMLGHSGTSASRS